MNSRSWKYPLITNNLSSCHRFTRSNSRIPRTSRRTVIAGNYRLATQRQGHHTQNTCLIEQESGPVTLEKFKAALKLAGQTYHLKSTDGEDMCYMRVRDYYHRVTIVK